MGTAAPKHFQYSAFCFVTCGAVTKRLSHLQPLIRISRRGERERHVIQDGRFAWPENSFVEIFHEISLVSQLLALDSVKWCKKIRFFRACSCFIAVVCWSRWLWGFCRMHCCQGAAVGPRGFWVTLSTCLWFLSAELISLDGAPYTLRSVTIFTFPFPAAKGPAFSCKHHLSSGRGTQ